MGERDASPATALRNWSEGTLAELKEEESQLDSQVAEFLPARVPIGHTPEVLARRRDEVEKRFCEALGVFFLSML